jgi:hypothetical protein
VCENKVFVSRISRSRTYQDVKVVIVSVNVGKVAQSTSRRAESAPPVQARIGWSK